MDTEDFKDTDLFIESSKVTRLLQELDINDPDKLVVTNQASLPTVVHNFIACQTETNARLIEFMGRQIVAPTMIRGVETSVVDQQGTLSEIATRQNLISRQLEKSLYDQLQVQKGNDCETPDHLINPPPMGSTFGVEAKVSDSGLRLITAFSGDSDNNETALHFFLREVYTLSQTSDLTESATVNVIMRKLSGSAQILLDDYMILQGGPTHVSLKQIVGHLEKKFVVLYSPLHADAQLHNLTQGELSYSQLQAKIQKLARLACRLEKPEDKRITLIQVKEKSAYMMAISTNDRGVLNTENARRATDNMPGLNLDMMSNFLARYAADKMNYKDSAPVFTVDGFQENNFSEGNPVAYVPNRGNFRSRYNGRRPNSGRVAPQQQQLRGEAPQRGQIQNYRYQRGGARNSRPTRFVTTKMANVLPNCCLLCGEASHGFKDPKCIYSGLNLMQSPCRRCQQGAHPTNSCKSNAQIGGQR